jgi:hypothetical protein
MFFSSNAPLFPLDGLICLIITGLCLFQTGCIQSNDHNVDPDFFTADYRMDDLEILDVFDGPVAAGELENTLIDEASGLAVSRANPGHVWTHNDHGDFNRLFLVGPEGQDAGTFRIEHTMNRDWEDLAIGPGPEDGTDYLYIADIGDNHARYDVKRIYRLPEPSLADYDLEDGIASVAGAEMIQFRYPDGEKDAETLMIDPLTKDLYIVSKREFPVTIYVARYPQNSGTLFEIPILGTLPFTDAVAGEFSADGSNIVIKTKGRIYIWDRLDGESVSEALQRRPKRLPYISEPQGEAFAWTSDGNRYYTLSEKADGISPVLYYYIRQN